MSRDRLTMVVATALVVAAVAGGVALATTGGSGGPAAHAENGSTIHVAASGSAASDPDKAVIRLAVEATAPNASVARRRVAENVSSVRAALADLGLNESQIRTTDYDLYKDERRERGPEGEPVERVVYRAGHELTVEVGNVSRAGAAIDAAIASGATDLYDIRFTLSAETRRRLRDEALSRAMTNARSKAETLATGANLTITGVDVVTTIRGGGHGGFEATPAPTAMAGGADTSISSGPVTVTVSVEVQYEAVEG